MSWVHVVDHDRDLWRRLASARCPSDLRQHTPALGEQLASSVATRLHMGDPEGPRVMIVPILRGGLLLYHSFAVAFPDADVCLLAMQRQGDGSVKCIYSSEAPDSTYDCIIYVDCVAGTGETLLRARAHLALSCSSREHLAAVLCSSREATARLSANDISIAGIALSEDIDAGLVLPDMGAADAGDAVASACESVLK